MRGSIHIRTIQRSNRCAAEETERAVNVVPQDLDRTGDTRFADGAEAICVGPSAEDDTRAKRDCFHHVRAAPNPAIHPNLGSSIHRGDYFRESPQ